MLYLLFPFAITWPVYAMVQDIQYLFFAITMIVLLAWTVWKGKSIGVTPSLALLLGFLLIDCLSIRWGQETHYFEILHLLNALALILVFMSESWTKNKLKLIAFVPVVWNVVFILLRCFNKDAGLFYWWSFNQEEHLELFNFFALWFVWQNRSASFMPRWLPWLLSVLVVVGLPLTTAKGMWISLAFVLASMCGLKFCKPVQSLKKFTWIIFVAISQLLIIGGMVFILQSSNSFDSLGSSVTCRKDLWTAASRLIYDHWFLGVGVGSFGHWIPDYWPSVAERHFKAIQLFFGGPHNLLLHIWAELGVLGFILYLAFSSSVVGQWLYTKSKNDWSQVRWFIPFWLGFLLLQSITFSLQGFENGRLVFLVLFLSLLAPAASKSKWNLSSKFVRYVSALLILMLCFAGLEEWNHARATQMVRNISFRGYLQSEEDIHRLQTSLAITPTSTAAYIGADLFLRLNMYSQSDSLLDIVEQLSVHRWPVFRQRVMLYSAEGRCADALNMRMRMESRKTEQEDMGVQRALQHCNGQP